MIKSYAGNWAVFKFGADVPVVFSHNDAAWSEILRQVPSAKLPQKTRVNEESIAEYFISVNKVSCCTCVLLTISLLKHRSPLLNSVEIFNTINFDNS